MTASIDYLKKRTNSGQPVRAGDWVELLYLMRLRINSRSDSMTFQTVGDIGCCRDEDGRLSPLKCFEINPSRQDCGPYGLDTQLIFGFSSEKLDQILANEGPGIFFTWGLTRRGARWILIKVILTPLRNSSTVVPSWIEIKDAHLPVIIDQTGLTYEDIWKKLSGEIYYWNARRQELVQESARLREECQQEWLVINFLGSE